jgi:predicted Zn-dependent protease
MISSSNKYRGHYAAVTRSLQEDSMRKIALLFLGLLTLTGCTTSPTSGHTIFTGLVSEQQENEIGYAAHADTLKQFHGVNDNTKLNEFVAMIGTRLVPYAERKDVHWTFTVLNDDMVNAFASPGGYIYVTRGLLNLAQDESQVAGVLAHEMGHINARHSAQQMSQGILANIGLQALGMATGSSAATQLGSVGAQGLIMSYSRDHEYEADALSIRYLAKAGYDPYATAKFLTILNQSMQLEAQMAGSKNAQQPGFFDSHPMTPDRVARAQALADQEQKNPNATFDREGYLRAIDGTVYGDAADAGFVRGNEYIHPGLQIRFAVPMGFHIKNTTKQVLAEDNNGAAIVFDMGKAATNDPAAYLTGTWALGANLTGQQRITVNSMAAATAASQVSTSKGARDAQLVAIDAGNGTFYRLTFLAPVGGLKSYSTVFRQATYSFAHDVSIKAISPNRVRMMTVRAGDTVPSLANQMSVQDYKVERFCLLNNVSPTTRLSPGTQVKTVR